MGKINLGKVKGDTGAKIVSTQLIGQDESGGNVYCQTFDNENTAEFIAPKGNKGDTGAKIVSTQLVGQDGTGSNVYRQTFDNGSTAEIIAPKGNKGDTGASIISTQFIGQDGFGGNVYRQTFDNGSTTDFVVPKGGEIDELKQRPMTADIHDWIPFGSAGMFTGEGSGILNAPNGNWWRYIGISHGNPQGYITILAMPLNMRTSGFFQKTCIGGVWYDWVEYAHKDETVPLNFINFAQNPANLSIGYPNASGLKIRLPFPVSSEKMVCFTVRFYAYYETADVQFSGYFYDRENQWFEPKAIMVSGSKERRIVMGKDNNDYAYVWIEGKTDYLGAAVLDVVGAYRDADWNTGWEMTFTDSIENIAFDKVIYPPFSRSNPPRLDITQTSNSQNNYMSAGGGFSPESGNNGAKLMTLEQNDCHMGFGADLSRRFPYDHTMFSSHPTNINDVNITFAGKTLDKPKEYHLFARITNEGIFEKDKRVYSPSNLPNFLDAYALITNKDVVAFAREVGAINSGITYAYGYNVINAPDNQWWRYTIYGYERNPGYVTIEARPLEYAPPESPNLLNRLLIGTISRGVWYGWTEFYSTANPPPSTSVPTKGSTDLFTAGGAQSLLERLMPTGEMAGNGYCKLANGLILQWGAIGGYLGTSAYPGYGRLDTITFPIGFPTACLNITTSVSTIEPAPSSMASFVNDFTQTSARITTSNISQREGILSFRTHYIAIGY